MRRAPAGKANRGGIPSTNRALHGFETRKRLVRILENCQHRALVTQKWLNLGMLLTAGFALAEDLPLPQQGSLPMRSDEAVLVKPSAVIRPPVSAPITVPAMRAPSEEDENRVAAILEMERRLMEEQVRRKIALAHANGNASALKQVIVMSGPVDAAVCRAAKPPTVAEGRVALIGLEKDAVVSKSLEHFFGSPMTPDREQELLDAVKSQFAANKEKTNFDVRIAGWWPDEGVMAVSVVPRG